MFKWLKQRKINQLLIDRARYSAYVEYDKDIGCRWEHSILAEIAEKLRQLGYKEQSNG